MVLFQFLTGERPFAGNMLAMAMKVLNDPGVKDALNKHGLTPQPTTRAELTAFMKKESTQWAAIIKERKLTAD